MLTVFLLDPDFLSRPLQFRRLSLALEGGLLSRVSSIVLLSLRFYLTDTSPTKRSTIESVLVHEELDGVLCTTRVFLVLSVCD